MLVSCCQHLHSMYVLPCARPLMVTRRCDVEALGLGYFIDHSDRQPSTHPAILHRASPRVNGDPVLNYVMEDCGVGVGYGLWLQLARCEAHLLLPDRRFRMISEVTHAQSLQRQPPQVPTLGACGSMYALRWCRNVGRLAKQHCCLFRHRRKPPCPHTQMSTVLAQDHFYSDFLSLHVTN